MITYSNIKRLDDNLSFEDYLKVEAYSHSFLKYQKSGEKVVLTPTDKMKLGKLVDQLLTKDDGFDFLDPQAEKAQRIATHIKSIFGPMIDNFEPQVSFTGDMELEGIKMTTCGRLDWLVKNFAVIDLKITEAKNDYEFIKLMKFMGYENQLWNYANLAQVPKAYILPYSTKINKPLSVISVPLGLNNEFWEQKIYEFGTAA